MILFVLVLSPAAARAAVPTRVAPGETLWSIAAASNLTTRTVAAYNGLTETAKVVLGATIMVPSTTEGYAALQKAGLVAAAPGPRPGCAGDRHDRGPHRPRAGAPRANGAYTVRWGDTLGRLASRPASRLPPLPR